MGLVAYDADVRGRTEAKYSVKKAKGKYLCPYCIEEGKKVPVFLVNTDKGNHFSSYNKGDHMDCDFVNSYVAKYQNAKIKDFNLEELYLSLLNDKECNNNNHSRKSSSVCSDELYINTIRQLYRVCMSNDLDYILSNDERSLTVNDVCVSLRNSKYWKEHSLENQCLLVVGRIAYVDFKRRIVHLEIAEKLTVGVEFLSPEGFSKFCTQRNKYGDKKNIRIYAFGKFIKKDYIMHKENKIINFRKNTVQVFSYNQIVFVSKVK